MLNSFNCKLGVDLCLNLSFLSLSCEYFQYETRTNLERYSNSGSISSDQLFGRETSSSSVGSGTDMGAIKDGMKDGVTQVAGKLSRMANGLYSSIQVSM